METDSWCCKLDSGCCLSCSCPALSASCPSGSSGSLPKALAELVRPAAVAAYQEALASVLTSGAVAKKKLKEAALKELEDAFVLLQLYASGADLLQVRLLLVVGAAAERGLGRAHCCWLRWAECNCMCRGWLDQGW